MAVHEATSWPTGQYMRLPRDLQGSAWGINSHLMAYMIEESSIHGSTWGHLVTYRAVHVATSRPTGQYMRPPRDLQGSTWAHLATYRAVHEATSQPTGQYMRLPHGLQGSAWGINNHLMAYMVEESSIHGSTWGHLATYRAVHEATSRPTGQYMRPPHDLQGSTWGHLATYRAVHEATSWPKDSTWGHLATYRAVHEATLRPTGQYMRPPRDLQGSTWGYLTAYRAAYEASTATLRPTW